MSGTPELLPIPSNVLLLRFQKSRFSTSELRELARALEEGVSQGMRVAILSGSGDVFCLGGDLGNYPEKSSREIREFGNALIDLHLTITRVPIPVIAAVNGPALGGGLSLVEACDLAVAGESARFGVPEIVGGLAPMISLVGVHRLARRKLAMELSFFGNEISAEEALRRGMVNRVVKDSEVLPVAVDWARRLAQSSPTAVGLCKQLYAQLDLGHYRHQLDLALDHLVQLLGSEDGREAYRAREEGRPPAWPSGVKRFPAWT